MSVTTTSLRQGKFEARFWHRIFEEEVGRVKGHFGPLNTYVDETFSLWSPRLNVKITGSRYTLQERVTPLEERTVSYACTILMRATSRHVRMVKQKFSTRVIVVCCPLYSYTYNVPKPAFLKATTACITLNENQRCVACATDGS
jgi:hypothetical protein